VLVVLIALPLAYFVREDPDDDARLKGSRSIEEKRARAPREDGARGFQPGGTSQAGESIGEILRTRAFYLLALGSMCSIAAVGGTNQHLKLFLSLDRGYTQGHAARIISLVLAVSIAGRLLMGGSPIAFNGSTSCW